VDALAEIGSRRALPALLDMLDTADERSLPHRHGGASASSGDASQVTRLLPLLEHAAKEVRLEADHRAGRRLVDDRTSD